MKNKGFTLVELLGVIIVLSLMVLIIVPSVDKAIKSGKSSADKQLEENIILAARAWGSDNKDQLPKVGIQQNVMLSFLQQQGYIDKNIKLPSTGAVFENACVQIKNVNKIYHYTYNRDCTVFMDLTIVGNRPESTWTNQIITLSAKSNYVGAYQWKKNGANIAGATAKTYNADTALGTETKSNYNLDLTTQGTVYPSKNTFIAWIDKKAPTIGTSVPTGWTATNKTITVSLTDGGIGTAAYYIGTTNSAPAASSTAWIAKALGTGATGTVTASKGLGTYYVFSKDKLNNISTGSPVTVSNIDTTPPTVSASVAAAVPSPTTRTIVMSLQDSQSGVAGYYVSTSSTKPAATASGWTALSLNGGQTGSATVNKTAGTYYIFAKDKVGNVSNGVSVKVVTDTTPPSCVWVSGPTGTNVNGYVKNGSTRTYVFKCTDASGFSDKTITASDFESSNSGVVSVSAVSGATTISGGYQWTITAKAGGTTGSAQLRLKAGAVSDALNNKNTVSAYSAAFKTDNTAPSITVSNSSGSNWQYNSTDGGRQVTISGNYSDAHSGVNTGTIQYKYSDGVSRTDWNSVTASGYSGNWSAARENQVWVRVADNLGNYSGWIDAGWVRIFSPRRPTVYVNGNWAGPGPSYFYTVTGFWEGEKRATTRRFQWLCYVHVASGDFYGSSGSTNWGQSIRLYGVGDYSSSGWVWTGWEGYGYRETTCTAGYQGSRYYSSSATASITSYATS